MTDRFHDARGRRHPEALGRVLQPDGRDLGAVALGRRALRRLWRHAADPRRASRVDAARFAPARPDAPAPRASRRFTFLSVFEWGERKAPEVLLRAYAAAFAGREERRPPPPAREQLRRPRGRRRPDRGARPARTTGRPSRSSTTTTSGRASSARSTAARTRSSCRRAAKAGECRSSRPWLAACPRSRPAWSGPSEFLHAGVGYPLAVRGLVPADAKCPYYEGFRWADPDPDDLVAKLRHVFTHREEARAKGAAAAAEAAAKWTWAHTAARIEERLREIGA